LVVFLHLDYAKTRDIREPLIEYYLSNLDHKTVAACILFIIGNPTVTITGVKLEKKMIPEKMAIAGVNLSG
jgi:hypothetical protein